jgi:hypothetical protein
MDHPMNNPGANTRYSEANTIVPERASKKMPIRLYSYEKILSLIQSDQGYPKVYDGSKK